MGRNYINKKAVWAFLRRHRWNLLIPLLVIPLVSYFGTFFLEPIYRASTILYTGDSFFLSDRLDQLVGGELATIQFGRRQGNSDSSLQNEIISTPYVSQLIRELKLDDDPELIASVEEVKSQWPHLSATNIMTAVMQSQLQNAVTIKFSGHDQIKIIVEFNDPYKARDIAQTLGKIFISEKMKQKIGVLRASQDFSYSQLERYQASLQDLLEDRSALEREFAGIKLDSAIFSEDNRRAIQAYMDILQTEITDEQAREKNISRQLSGILPAKISLDETAELIKRKSEIAGHLESVNGMILKQSWNSSEFINFNRRLYASLASVEKEIKRQTDYQFKDRDDSTRNLMAQLFYSRALLDALISKRSQIASAYDELMEKWGKILEYNAKIDQFDREEATLREMVDRLQEHETGSTISQAILRESDFKVIEPAELPLRPVRPNQNRIIIISIFLALMVGGGAAALLELTDTTYKAINNIEEELGVPVLGVIPEISSLNNTHPMESEQPLEK